MRIAISIVAAALTSCAWGQAGAVPPTAPVPAPGTAPALTPLPMPAVAPAPGPAQPPAPVLTLAQAEQMAVTNHPLLAAANFNINAAQQNLRVVRSDYYPILSGDLTGALAENGTRIGAGLLNNPSVLNRYANGLSASQLITDFGRTGALVASARSHAQAAASNAQATRADVLLGAAQAYFDTLRSEALLQVAQETVDERQQVTNQVSQLTTAQLRSELDEHFAEVNLAQAKVDLSNAQAAVSAAFAQLAMALGLPGPRTFTLNAEAVPAEPGPDVAPLVAQALAQRPEMAAARLETRAAVQYAQAEGDLSRPTLSAVGAAGWIPAGQTPLPSHYAAIGANLNIPIFNGSQFSAEHAEALANASAESEQMRQLQDTISRDVYDAWLNARTAYEQLSLTQELLDQATMALNLAQSRYRLGLGTIVELTQAQLNLTQAQTQHANAIYDFEILNIALQYELGTLR